MLAIVCTELPRSVSTYEAYDRLTGCGYFPTLAGVIRTLK